MFSSKILPVVTPDILSYQHTSYFHSILYTDKNMLGWVYSNYIQLSLSEWDGGMMLDYITQTPVKQHIPGFEEPQRMTRQTLLRFAPNFSDFVRNSIDEGFYVWTHVDEFYIPGTVAYQNHSNPHGILIYGYEEQDRVFHITGYLANQRYGSAIVSYDQIENGFKEFEVGRVDYKNYTHLLKLDEASKHLYDFNVPWVMEQLSEYVYATPSHWRMQAYEEKSSNPIYWGMDVFDKLQSQIKRHIAKEFILDHRPFYILCEHKKMMNRRLDYMKEHGYFTFSANVMNGYRKVEQDAMRILNLELRYLLSLDNQFLEQVIERLGHLKAEETLVIEQMLDEYSAAIS
jgi:hypothetical protein